MRSAYWNELTSGDLAGLAPETDVALLPVAAVEQHGPHLPLATDALINAALVRALLARVPDGLLALPPMQVGHSLEHTRFAGTLSIAAETLLASWLDVGRSVASSGVRKLIILNTHGGNSALVHIAALRLRAECNLLAVRGNYFALGAPAGLFPDDELRHGLHGGEMETSLMLHWYPQLVRRDATADFPALTHALAGRHRLLGVEKPIGIGWMSQDVHPAGVSGNAARADAARGASYADYLVDALVTLVQEVAALPLATLKD